MWFWETRIMYAPINQCVAMVEPTSVLLLTYLEEYMPKGIEEWSDRPDYDDNGEPNE